MTRVGVRELKGRLGSYLAQVRRGATLIITDRGVPIARLEALEETPPPDSIRSLVEGGLVRYRRPGHDGLAATIALEPGDGSAVDFVIDQRR